MDAELWFHLEARTEDLVRGGAGREEARRQAQMEFGGVERAKEECRDARGVNFVEGIAQDVRYGLRVLGKSPGFTAVAVVTLALGIGANTAIFSLVDQILLRRLPVNDPGQLVMLETRGRYYGNSSSDDAVSYPMYKDFEAQNEVFSGMFCRRHASANLSFSGQAERVHVELVSSSYFGVLGVGAAMGRTFTPDEDRVPDGSALVVLSYSFWKQRFGGDPGVVGKTILLNNRGMVVIGVAQQGFYGVGADRPANIFAPITMEELFLGSRRTSFLIDRRSRWLYAFGRLKPGMTPEQAKAGLQPLMHAMLEMEVREPAFNHASAYDREEFLKSSVNLWPGSRGSSSLRRDLKTPLWVLMAITGFVLLIACANLANFLLSRAAGRQKEIAVRLAIGASRGRVLRQLLVESLLLSMLGGIAGLLLAFWADEALMAIYLRRESAALGISTTPDMRVLLFALGVTFVTGIAFGLGPALQSTKPDVNRALKDEAGLAALGGRGGLRRALVIGQVAVSLVLLVGAGLFLRTMQNLRGVSPGFAVERLIGFELNPWLNGYNLEESKLFYERLSENLRAIPGVESVGLAAVRILSGDDWDSGLTVEGYSTARPEDRPQAYMNKISASYFATLGVPLLAGRDFAAQDSRPIAGSTDSDEASRVAIINETFARRFFPAQNPISRHLGFGTDPGTKTTMEIIGVVKDMKYTGLRDDIPGQVFLPYLATGFTGSQSEMTVYLRTAGDPGAVMRAAREKVHEMDSNLPVYAMRTTEEQISDSLSTERMIASLSSAFGFLATLLAAIGLYGLMSYGVARRTREIGIRMALGATQGYVLRMVMREVLLLAGLGLGLGLLVAVAVVRLEGHWLSGILFGVPATDGVNIAVAALLMAGVAVLAGFLPARRATQLDPMVALRYE